MKTVLWPRLSTAPDILATARLCVEAGAERLMLWPDESRSAREVDDTFAVIKQAFPFLQVAVYRPFLNTVQAFTADREAGCDLTVCADDLESVWRAIDSTPGFRQILEGLPQHQMLVFVNAFWQSHKEEVESDVRAHRHRQIVIGTTARSIRGLPTPRRVMALRMAVGDDRVALMSSVQEGGLESLTPHIRHLIVPVAGVTGYQSLSSAMPVHEFLRLHERFAKQPPHRQPSEDERKAEEARLAAAARMYISASVRE